MKSREDKMLSKSNQALGQIDIILCNLNVPPSWIQEIPWRIQNFIRWLRQKCREIAGRVPEEKGWRWFVAVFIRLRRRDADKYLDCEYFQNVSAYSRKSTPMRCDGLSPLGACKFCRHLKR